MSIESPVRAPKRNVMMEGAIRIWQGQLRATKHFAGVRLKRRIKVDGVLFSWLIPSVTEIVNTCGVGSGGRMAYERITEHKCRHFMIGFGEVVEFILETDKNERYKADSPMMKGIFLGYI